MIVLDTTVLVYAVGDQHRFQAPCRRLLSAVGAGEIVASTTPEVIQEFAHVRARRRPRADAVQLAEAYADLLAPLVVVDEQGLRAGLHLFGEHPQLGSFDSVLVATASALGVAAVVSADETFRDAAGVRHVVPDDDGITGLLT